MSKPQMRSSHLITTFGPGAMIDLPNDAAIIAGLDNWRYNNNIPLPTISEPRLQKKVEAVTGIIGVTLRKPPAAIEDRGFTPDIGAYKFPEWFIVQRPFTSPRGNRARRLVHLNDINQGKYRDVDGKRYPVVPVRFVRACYRGHVGDIRWHDFVHGAESSCRRELRFEDRGLSGDLDSIWVCCACGAERAMGQAAIMSTGVLGRCDGSRPWLGPHTREECGLPNRLLTRSASNAYFSQVLSVISIPDSVDAVDRAVNALWGGYLSGVKSEDELRVIMGMPALSQQLEGYTASQVMASINRLREGASSEDRPVKDVEFDVLTQEAEEIGLDDPDSTFYAKKLPPESWAAPWMASIERVLLVHRLREVVAQVGFTRFEAAGPDIQGELDITVERAPIGLNTNWIPAIENRGEGIFLQFKIQDIQNWLGKPAVQQRDAQLQGGFQSWAKEHEGSSRYYPGLPYYMVHSFSHLLLTAISLECGYPASSLRERIYAMPNKYGLLLYTGSPDAEGTLGGLIEEGRRIKYHVRKALEMASLCSNDPVCAFHVPQSYEQQPMLGSACHGCLLISETSCEQGNDFLDRALVVETVQKLGSEFFRWR